MYRNAMTVAHVVMAAALAGCGRADFGERVEVVMSNDPVQLALNSVSALHESVSKAYTQSSIRKYKIINGELLEAGVVPKTLLRDGKLQTPLGTGMQVQVFPADAWRKGVPATVNYVFGAVPKKECAELVRLLSRQPKASLFQLNVEPAQKVHSEFPVSGNEGCGEGANDIGYTIFAK